MEETKFFVFRVAVDHGKHITRDDIEGILEHANEHCRLNETPFEHITVPAEFVIAADRLMDDRQARALTIVVDRVTGHLGWAFCHERDQFNREVGVLLAANRLADQLKRYGKRVWFTDADTGEKSLLTNADGLADPDLRNVLRHEYGIYPKRRRNPSRKKIIKGLLNTIKQLALLSEVQP